MEPSILPAQAQSTITNSITTVTPRKFAPRIETTRTILELFDPSNPSDVDFLLSLYVDPEVQRVHGVASGISTREELLKTFETGLLNPELPEISGGYGGLCLYMAHARLDAVLASSEHDEGSLGAYIGFVALRHRVVELPDVGYVMSPTIWGKGFATEVCKGLLDYVIGEMGVRRVCGFTVPGHTASMRVLEKSGLVYVGNGVVVDTENHRKYENEMFVVPGMEANGVKGGILEGWVLHVR